MRSAEAIGMQRVPCDEYTFCFVLSTVYLLWCTLAALLQFMYRASGDCIFCGDLTGRFRCALICHTFECLASSACPRPLQSLATLSSTPLYTVSCIPAVSLRLRWPTRASCMPPTPPPPSLVTATVSQGKELLCCNFFAAAMGALQTSIPCAPRAELCTHRAVHALCTH